MLKIKDRINDDVFIEVCKTSLTMAEAARKLGIHYNSLVSRAKKLNCYTPNQSGKNTKKRHSFKFELNEILVKNSVFNNFSSLRKRLIKHNLKENKCENCGLTEWLGETINLHLHHIDGDNSNNTLENLKILCPNCHSQTDNYCSKNMKKYKKIESIYDIFDVHIPKYQISEPKKLKIKKQKIKIFKYKCLYCGKETDNEKYCSVECHKNSLSIIPDKEILIKDINEYKSFYQISKKYNVSDKTIKKWCIKHKILDEMLKYRKHIKK